MLRALRAGGERTRRRLEFGRSGRYGFDDFADGALRVVGHPDHVRLALLGRAKFGSLLLGPHALDFQPVLLEHFHG